MTNDDVLRQSDADGVRTLILNRPNAYNSLTVELKERLLAALRDAGDNPDVKAIVLTGAGKAFCAGQDLKEHVGLLQAGDEAPLRTVAEHYNPIVLAIAELPKPVIAAVNGPAAGAGAALAYASDLRIAATSANFLMAFANVGLGPDTGASWTLQRLIGYGRAAELMLLARPVEAEEALRIGLVGEVVADEDLAGRAQAVAAKLAAGPTVAYAKIKSTLRAAAEGTLAEALAVEDEAQGALGATADHAEAVEAFVAKRKPRFTGS
ncbi:enoyl-CoA hydratase [Prauserella marina]|uniref:2-(1,2-epoxy-1,2-dihydrophenyl)acetyl-CoA isomerase n=1 Tax=Prauserella marina TaxID=530584 RepID=A0A222VKF6_9PSEU|nr:enoyl-CoA hydratase-related protein [Prauserella marina]ASR34302.1 enoyl-CoA hydratase [Prauserella marina]PWV71918.1 2-(1,2-epoxy-1,2-dihydrophenyl)acetyl-CoA isomerase [Prauserella marina]SDD90847.1 2-(1,2-epoxy-1,2-dihydrophenyl)acetyl-CoA isomerase [Prauserella marina]